MPKNKKIKLRRGILLTALLLMVASFGSCLYRIHVQTQALELERQAIQAQTKTVVAENQTLEDQISLLQEDDYVMKIARGKYYMSDKGEVIFVLPR